MMRGSPKKSAHHENEPARPSSTLPTTSPSAIAVIAGYTSENAMPSAVNSFSLNFLAAVSASTTGRK